MLGALIRQAERAGLVTEPGFAPKELRWLAQLSGERLTGVLPLSDGRKGLTFTRCPEMGQPEMMALPRALGQAQAAHFLADTCGVVALLPATDKDGKPKTDDKSLTEQTRNADKHQTFRALLQRASESLPELGAVASALEDPEQLAWLRAELLRQGAKPTDKISFEADGLNLLESSDWHDWWRSFRRETFGRTGRNEGGGMLDLTSGERIMPANTHPKLGKLGVGAIAMGASLVGYDKEAFTSYGFAAGENGAVSEDNAAAYHAALDNLLDTAPILGQMKVAVWFDHRQTEGQVLVNALVDPPSLAEVTEEFFSLDDFDPEEEVKAEQTPEQQAEVARQRARKLLTAIRKGEEPDRLTARYFALAISGASGRAMVRDWHTGSLESLAEAVVMWFDDLAITSLSGKRANRPGLMRLLMCIQRPKSQDTKLDDYLKPVRNLQLPLWRAALDPGMPLPLSAISKVMEAHKAHVMTGKFTEALSREGSNDEKGRVYARMALIRAFHNRKARTQGGYLMSTHVDLNHPSPAYHCGRLMYLLANLQEAQGSEINAGVVQRYYGAASATPALVLGRLTRLSQHHLSKIGRDRPGLAFTLERDIAQVWTALGKDLPRTLTLEQQSLFALGYYQQLAAYSTERQERAAAKRAAEGQAGLSDTATPEVTSTEKGA
ncbi:type I-C CRISPR-associated protein Cas8c/Csd1 (plasmid) [Deinococcus metallilatus]|uniref:CRISPR-associated protein Csd1 n=1 Tax=Deinococcus metallilatus TaxID=1211322 RepID=A0AAJ5F708_9DEIO|nr:type I-C CRISPR-associated protein Cas8c/Csd1 [Deinococcus metallilatus]MBB5293201.1 CRISPR-associated protein Csd1 [Deinococcus metallilatus]QBY06993.1 type I-C CRISPR-associated protein Cas8c/Csd1 [Deinococcus metallilatus]RXJ18004.1 type I-C CRISPR-associated protein Cas8c/Csd1 [Deinococcus metallilatus]TLK31940.1 type I-C CRISPR-associated protein Cas8c/Csd1 [Deinococcus metallilatus]GMA15575.1 hypothetical protein GCM10025871_19060 [Deinococcus metallilatus]